MNVVRVAVALLWIAVGPAGAQLVPRAVFFGNPDRTQVRVSPDGSTISFLASVDGVMNVWVAPADAPQNARPVTSFASPGVPLHAWAPNGTHVLCMIDEDGSESWRLISVAMNTGRLTPLTPAGGVQARLVNLSPAHPDEALVGLNDRDPRLHDLWAVNTVTGARRLVRRCPEGVGDWAVDPRWQITIGTRVTLGGGGEILLVEPDSERSLGVIPPEDLLTTAVLSVSDDHRTIYLRDSRGRDTSALVSLALQPDSRDEQPRVLLQDAKSDLSMVLLDPLTGRPLAAAFEQLRRRWDALDETTQQDLKRLGALLPGEIEVTSQSDDLTRWVVASVEDDGPVSYYLVDRRRRGECQTTFLFHHREALEHVALSPMRPVIIRARDGLELVSYLTLPVGAAPEGAISPSSPLPMVLLVHGGPWARDRWGYHPIHQLLANRGYAVLSVNFRGSTGFGKAFVNAGDREWGAKMNDDLIDAVVWAIRHGVADSARIGIVGASYGGYAALMATARSPDMFACAVDVMGPSSLPTLLRSIPPYWEPQRALWSSRVGDVDDPADIAMLIERSPVTHVDRMTCPLLVVHGSRDPRVRREESDEIVSQLCARGVPVTYAVFPDEGHGLRRPANSIAFVAITEQFLATHLGGLAEPVGRAISESSAVVQTGGDLLDRNPVR
ncbi:MAG: S9 family peptidase [Phycisphaeraceae bacterium]|nr:S9 family peptidase [Phycisphaeraceae bacterium]